MNPLLLRVQSHPIVVLVAILAMVSISNSSPHYAGVARSITHMATRRAEGGKHLADNASPAGKVVYCSVTMIGTGLLFYCAITRAMKITLKKVKEDLNVIRVIVFLLYIDGILFLMSSAILYFVWGLALKGRCEAAIQLCLVFYLSGKVLMYLFLVERSHVVRRSGFRRQSDVWYYFNMAQVLLGFGTIAILSFFRPVAQIDPWDEVCKIGLPFRITLPLLIFDIWINVFLTVQFIFFARRFMSNWVPRTLRDAWGKAIHPRLRNDGPAPLEDNPADQRGILADMAWRTCKAMFIVLSTTIANLSVLFALRGHEQGWLCFLMCSVDVVGAIVTIHWLTNEEGQRNEPSNAPNNRDSVVTTYTHPATPENELHRFHSGAYSQTSSRHAYEQK